MFVNSIKTARRLDGLLWALGLNCRTVHSQLQQRQRLRALDSFRASPIGVLVATDIAARGLDIPKVEYVVHYDIARSAQVVLLFVTLSGQIFLFDNLAINLMLGLCPPIWKNCPSRCQGNHYISRISSRRVPSRRRVQSTGSQQPPDLSS